MGGARKRITVTAIVLTLSILTTIVAILSAQLLDSFQVLFQETLLENANNEGTSGTTPQNMLEGAKELWTHRAKLLATLLILWSGIWPHVKLLMLLLVLHSGAKYPALIRSVEWLGRWAFLDVYFVVLVALSFSLPDVQACILGMCTHVGWLQAVPLSGIYLFTAAAIASQILSRIVASTMWYPVYEVGDGLAKKNDSERSLAKSLNLAPRDIQMKGSYGSILRTSSLVRYFLGSGVPKPQVRRLSEQILVAGSSVLLAILFLALSWAQNAPLFTVEYASPIRFAKLSGPRIFSVTSVWTWLLTSAPHLTDHNPVCTSLLVGVCATCVTVVPLVRLLLLWVLHTFAGQSQSSVWKYIRKMEVAISFWSHVSVFSLALLLLVFEVRFLSRQIDIASILPSSISGGTAGREGALTSLLGGLVSSDSGVGGSDIIHSSVVDIQIRPYVGTFIVLFVVGIFSDFSQWSVHSVGAENHLPLDDNNDPSETDPLLPRSNRTGELSKEREDAPPRDTVVRVKEF